MGLGGTQISQQYYSKKHISYLPKKKKTHLVLKEKKIEKKEEKIKRKKKRRVTECINIAIIPIIPKLVFACSSPFKNNQL